MTEVVMEGAESIQDGREASRLLERLDASIEILLTTEKWRPRLCTRCYFNEFHIESCGCL